MFCNLGESAPLLVWFLPFILPHFFFAVAIFHCWVVIIFCTRSHTDIHWYTDRPSFGVVSSLHPLIAIFPVILLVFFALLHLCTHFLCLSILFLSNMLLADTLFSSRLPLLGALNFGVCVDFFVGQADFTPTLELSNNCCCFHW